MKNQTMSTKSSLKFSIIFGSGLLIGSVLTVVILFFVSSKMMFTVSESKYGFDQTAEVITKKASELQWSMPHQYDLQQTMAKNGFEVKPVKVFSLCKPNVAVGILGNDENRSVSSMMPCRISIYEKADGKTYISRMNSGLLSKLMGGKAAAIMNEAGTGMEDILKVVVKN
jgi:uncharacterized protein (DUF302 family)